MHNELIDYNERALMYSAESFREEQGPFYARNILKNKIKDVLIVPCSSGNLMFQLSSFCDNLFGADNEHAMISVANESIEKNEFFNCHVFCCDIRDILMNRYVDLVIVPNEAIHMFSMESDDIKSVLHSLHKCCAPGGRLIIESFNYNLSCEDKLSYFSHNEVGILVKDDLPLLSDMHIERYHIASLFKNHLHIKYCYHFCMNELNKWEIFTTTLYLHSIEDLCATMRKHGFRVINIYHGYSSHPFIKHIHGQAIIEAVRI